MPQIGGLTTQPLLQQEFIDGVRDATFPSEKQYVTPGWFPQMNLQSSNVKWDEQSPLNHGLTLPVAQGAESPVIQGGHFKQFSVTPGHFREKYILRDDEIIALRRLGTTGDSQSGQEIMAHRVLWLQGRVQDRMEWAGWNALFGQIAISQNNVNYTVNFPINPAYNIALSGPALWSAPATANPIDDILNMVNLTRGFGFRYGSMWMNGETARIALQIAQFRGLFNSAIQGGALAGRPMAMETLSQILQLHIPGMPNIVVWDHGYQLEQALTVAALAAQPSVIVEDVTDFAAGLSVTLDNSITATRETFIVLSVVAATNTITFTTNLANTYPAASVAQTFRRYIPDGKVLFMPEPTPTVPSIGKFYFTPTSFGGNLLNPQPGVFMVTHNYEIADPPRVELIAGFSGMPVPQYRDTWAILTVL